MFKFSNFSKPLLPVVIGDVSDTYAAVVFFLKTRLLAKTVDFLFWKSNMKNDLIGVQAEVLEKKR